MKDSEHKKNIIKDSDVQLLYMEFLSVYGKASIKTDRTTLKSLYGESDNMWFEGVDDPYLTAICIEPTKAYYWDSKHNKLVTIFKMGVGAVTGDQPDISNSGKIVL